MGLHGFVFIWLSFSKKCLTQSFVNKLINELIVNLSNNQQSGKEECL